MPAETARLDRAAAAKLRMVCGFARRANRGRRPGPGKTGGACDNGRQTPRTALRMTARPRLCDPPVIRAMTPADLPAVLAVQRACYLPEMNEAAAVLRERLAQAPDFAWIAAVDREIRAYLVGYPSRLGKVTPLGGGFEPPATPDCLYLHDLAVAPAAGGRGLGSHLLRHALAIRPGWPAALVCVQQALPFWQRAGFVERRLADPVQAARLAGYPGPARYMVRPAG